MSDFWSFDTLQKAFGSYGDFTKAKTQQKIDTVTAANERRRLEVAAFEAETAGKAKIIEAAAAFSRQENLFALASTIAIGMATALGAAAFVKLYKAVSKK